MYRKQKSLKKIWKKPFLHLRARFCPWTETHPFVESSGGWIKLHCLHIECADLRRRIAEIEMEQELLEADSQESDDPDWACVSKHLVPNPRTWGAAFSETRGPNSLPYTFLACRTFFLFPSTPKSSVSSKPKWGVHSMMSIPAPSFRMPGWTPPQPGFPPCSCFILSPCIFTSVLSFSFQVFLSIYLLIHLLI